jgi:hypothetical protein
MVPDNLKAAVIQAAFGAADPSCALNRSYREWRNITASRWTPPRGGAEKKAKLKAGCWS